MTTQRILVVGGGPAGLMAAGQAALQGAAVLLLEKMARPGRKLLLTGGGRCNLTNDAPLDAFIASFGPQGPFLRQALARFFSADLRAFFEELGVPSLTEPDGRVFPVSGRAEDVLEALLRWNARSGVTLQTGAAVQRLLVEGGRIAGVQVVGEDAPRPAGAVILATGGASYPGTGSSGDGYRLAEAAGHTIVPVRPALVPLETAGDVAARLQGLSLQGVSVRLWCQGKRQAAALGDVLFTHFGLSGPLVLSLSRQAVDALREGRRVSLSIDLQPGLDEGALDEHLRQELDRHGRQKLGTLLRGLLPARLAAICLEGIAVEGEKWAHQVTAAERGRLRAWLKDFRLEVSGHRPLREAQVTAGGVDTAEVDPRTMASRLVAGLYFAGEVLDVDGDSGGYNLQAAFSTGWLAGRAAVVHLQGDTHI